jgi:hypothetical protein
MKNKRALSTLIVTVLLTLLVLGAGSLIFVYSKNILNNAQKDAISTRAQAECPKMYNIELTGCFDKDQNTIKIDIINLNEDIPAGSLLSLESDKTKILTLLDPIPPFEGILKGAGKSIEIKPVEVNFNTFNLEMIKIVPLFIIDNNRVLCDSLESVEVQECPAS